MESGWCRCSGGLDRAASRFVVAIDDAHALRSLANLFHGEIEMNNVREFFCGKPRVYGPCAHRLETWLLHVKHLLEEHAIPQVGVEQRMHIERIMKGASLVARARQTLYPERAEPR